MKPNRYLFTRAFAALGVLLILSGAFGYASARNVRLILVANRADYAALSKAVGDVQGKVEYTYKYAGAMTVTVPADKVTALVSRPEVLGVLKDEMVSLPEPRMRDVPGYGMLPLVYTATPDQSRALTADELQQVLRDAPANYFPFENELTHAFEFSSTTNHFGENVIVGIIDAGVSRDAIAAAGAGGTRIIGAENFTTDGIPADSRLNGPHGTWVACCVGANAVFGFAQTSTLLKAVKAYAPGSVLPDFFAPGIDGIPMVGQAPSVQFYAFKVFPAGANSTSRTIIAAALERAIELKENFNKGAGGVNIRIVNLSLGGTNLFAGNDPVYAPLVKEANQAGIVLTISAGNSGPAGLSIGTPGDSKNILTAGASSDATHVRIFADLAIAPGAGMFYRPVDNNLVADFSSRGPTADGRLGVNITAPGDWRYAQGADTRISLVSGTSFSSPTIAGAAALLISAHPAASPEQIRAALLAGANPKLLNDKSQKVDQGFGFLDVMAANKKFGAFNPFDFGLSTPFVRINALPFGINAIDARSFSGSTGWLVPGQRKEFYIQTTMQPLAGLTVQVSVTPELPGSAQNQFFGDDAEVTVATGKTSTGDYRVFDFVPGSKTYVLDEDALDMGLTKVGITGDLTNAGRIKADVQIVRGTAPKHLIPIAHGRLAQGQQQTFAINMPAGLLKTRFVMSWFNGWETWPTNDLDMLLIDPSGNPYLVDRDGDNDIDGQGLDTPERITVDTPATGPWTLTVFGSTVWRGNADFVVFSDMNTPPSASLRQQDALLSVARETPGAFALRQNSPNPFNPSTTISYNLPADVHVRLAVYNTLGQEVASLVDEVQSAGEHHVVFQDPGLASGVYFYHMQAGQSQATNKMILMK